MGVNWNDKPQILSIGDWKIREVLHDHPEAQRAFRKLFPDLFRKLVHKEQPVTLPITLVQMNEHGNYVTDWMGNGRILGLPAGTKNVTIHYDIYE